MSLSPEERIILLEERLGIEFPDPELALTALTHRSWLNENPGVEQEDNERLEFLGDAVVELAISHRLMLRFPVAKEGLLSRMRAALVNAEILAKVADEIDLGELLLLGKGEEMTGGRRKISLLSNCFEAVLGAVFMGSGLGPVQEMVDRLLIPHIELLGLDLSGGRDYKTRVQEEAQLILGKTPKYRVVSEQGPDHEKTFTVELVIDDEVFGRAEGRSKKEAEQGAARSALIELSFRAQGESPKQDEVDTEIDERAAPGRGENNNRAGDGTENIERSEEDDGAPEGDSR